MRNNSQLSNLMLIPVLKLFHRIRGDYDGIYLGIRYLYTILKILVSFYTYITLRKINKLGAMVSSLCFFVFAGYGMMVLSYNSMASGGVLMTILLLIGEESGKVRIVKSVIAGAFLSIAVLANPYVVMLYIVYAVVVFYAHIKKKSVYPLYSMRSFCGVKIGAGICFLAFIACVFHRTSLAEFIRALPHILLGDPAHPVKSFYYLTGGYFARILVGNHRNFYLFGVYILIGIVLLVFITCRDKDQYRNRFILLSAILSVVLLIVYMVTDNYINYIIYVPNVLAFVLVCMVGSDKIKKLFLCFWVPGVVYTYLEYLSSNTGVDGISSASCVASVGSILIIIIAMEEESIVKKCKIPMGLFVMLTFICLVVYRFTYVFGEDGLKSLTREITDGPCSGLVVNEKQYQYYNSVYSDTQEIRKMSADTKVLYISDQSLWLAGEQRCASYSPLCYSITSSNLIYEYYEEHPNKRADVIYIDNIQNVQWVEGFALELDLKIQEKESGWILFAHE